MDFKPDDFGDDAPTFSSRVSSVVTAALARVSPVTPEQQEAGARYILLSGWIRQLARQIEVFSVPGEIGLTQGLAVRMGQLRYDQRVQLNLSGLPNASAVTRPASTVVGVVSTY